MNIFASELHAPAVSTATGTNRMDDYESIRDSCLKRGVLWEDPGFPVTQSSVFYYQTPPFVFAWKRPKEIYACPSFIMKYNPLFDVGTGKLGDKWLVSCLGAVFQSKGIFHRMVPGDQTLFEPYAGIFRFRLWWCGQWREVLVDDRLPTVHGALAFLKPRQTKQFWAPLLEKAYAKLHGSYEALKYGRVLDGLAEMTGGIIESMSLATAGGPTGLSSLISAATIVTAQHMPLPPELAAKTNLVPEMYYTIKKVQKIYTSTGEEYLVLIRAGQLRSKTCTAGLIDHLPHRVVDEELLRIGEGNGEWILYSDFERLFGPLEMVHLDHETARVEPDFAHLRMWHMKMYQGTWRRGISAGGCRNHICLSLFRLLRGQLIPIFHVNPQIQLILDEPDTVIISLNQHSIMDPKVVGFSIYRLVKSLEEIAPQALFDRNRSCANSQYTNSRQVSHRLELAAGAYLVLPTTFEPRQEGNFTLRVFSTKALCMLALDCPPRMVRPVVLPAPASGADTFAQYEAVFIQLADEHRTIDMFELQELLDACLPNDYIKSCACIDTCRQIVFSMDKNGSGRITLSDFKNLICSLKHWQTVFQTHAREKMGVLLAERLRDALNDLGFTIPERAMASLVQRYMRKDGMLRFGDFVSAVMHLHRVFNVFHSKDGADNGSVNVNMSEWLHCALMC